MIKMVLLYNRVIQHIQIPVNKLDTKWNWSFNKTCKSLKGILVLFEEEKPFARDTSKFDNPKYKKSPLPWKVSLTSYTPKG